ncbi:MAG: hypothetical protein J3R72DRAFT_523581 [Linnemannia gamsii]|nr:MAG: hypothetical protein J3R72DRAFT_523581 [Linnemannia gamsii]
MSAPPPQQQATIAPAQAPPSRPFQNIWVRSDPSMLTPHVDDSSGTTTIFTTSTDTMSGQGGMEDGTADPNTQALQHKHSAATIDTLASNEGASSSSTTTTATGIEDLMSRADVFAGVIVFSIGMLVLIIAVTFYFANGRSLRTVRRNRNRDRRGQDDMRSRDAGDDGVCVGAEVNQEGDIDLEQNVHTVMSTVPTGAGTGTGGGGGMGERTSTFDPHSPSTARLIDHPTTSSPSSSFPSTSVFSFLKGTHPSSSPSNNNSIRSKSTLLNATSIISKTGQDYETRDGGDSEATTALHMPVLTRTKARSSCKKKSKGMISLFSSVTTSCNSGTVSKKQKQKQRQAAALEIVRSASAIIIQVQEPSEPASARPFTPNTNHDTSSSSSSFSPSDAYHEDPSEDIFSPIHPHPHNNTYSHPYPPPLLRLEMPSQIRSSSLVGLYGSAKSSPNGSMLDAASTRAIYCTSLKSAISFLPAESSTSTLGVLLTAELNPTTTTITTTQEDDAGQDSNGKEIVIATAGLEVDLSA